MSVRPNVKFTKNHLNSFRCLGPKALLNLSFSCKSYLFLFS